jgi:hypothetical protein
MISVPYPCDSRDRIVRRSFMEKEVSIVTMSPCPLDLSIRRIHLPAKIDAVAAEKISSDRNLGHCI